MQTTWIVTADASRARILQVAGRERLVEIQDLANPAGRLHERELIEDAEPRFSGHGGVGKPGSRSTSGPASDRQGPSAHDHETERFAKLISEALDKARNERRFERLYLVAPPKFLGKLRKELGKETAKLVVDELDKDLSWLDLRSLEAYLARQK